MLLHARRIAFKHPTSAAEITLTAPYQDEFERMLETLFGLDSPEVPNE